MASYSERTADGASDKVWKKAKKLKEGKDLTSFREFVSAINEFEFFIKKMGESLTS